MPYLNGLMKLMSAPGDFHGPVNLGNPGEFTMQELALKIIELVGSSSKLTYHRLPDDDPTRRRPDIELADIALDWRPIVALEEGLKKTISYFEKIIS